jgi:hypothetical protein
MKKLVFPSLLAATVLGLAACGSDSNNSTSTTGDTSTMNTAGTGTTTDGSTSGSATSTTSYAAFADSVERNSTAGYYVNPRTGKKMNLRVNRETGAVTDDAGEPVYRYVDTRNWWVYGIDDSDWTWRQQGEAKMDNNTLTYKGDNDQWIAYDKRWNTSDEDRIKKSWKEKYGDAKVKVSKDGDIKVKTEEGKVKYDADDNKIKTDKDN